MNKERKLSGQQRDSLRAVKQWVAVMHRFDSLQAAFARCVHEPDIKGYDHPVYRYRMSLFLRDDFIFRVEEIGSKWILTSKWVADECEHCDWHQVLVKGKQRRVRYGDVIDSTVQQLSQKEWNTFSRLLEGSYYRQLQSLECSDGILDGNSLELETMSPSVCLGIDSLEYHRIAIHVPRKGSFRDACIYLVHVSELTRYKFTWLDPEK